MATVKPLALSWRWTVSIEASGAGSDVLGTGSLISADIGPGWLAIPRICSLVASPENQPEMFATGRPRSEAPMAAPESFPRSLVEAGIDRYCGCDGECRWRAVPPAAWLRLNAGAG